MRWRSLSVLAALPCAAFTNCGYFAQVPVPPSDTTSPVAHGMVYDAGGTLLASSVEGWNPPYSLAISPGTWVNAVGSSIDGGGLNTLRIDATDTKDCCNNSSCTSHGLLTSTFMIINETQPRQSLVSTGIWNYESTTVGSCPSGPLLWWTRSYTVYGTDFFGNMKMRNVGTLHYP